MNKTEFKFVLSYENANKNYGSGKGIHITVRGDKFGETFQTLQDRIRDMETLLVDKPKETENLDLINKELAGASEVKSTSGESDPR